MRILLYGINFPPEIVGIGKYSGEMAEWLKEQGHDVRIVTAPPYYPAWRIAGNYSGSWYKTECSNGQKVIRCPLWVPRTQSGLKRVLHLLSFAASSLPCILWQGLFWRPNIVVTVAPAFACAPGAWLAARLGSSHASLHIQDFEVDAAFELGLLKGRWIRALVSKLERWMLRRFDSVSTISKRMSKVLTEKRVECDRQVLFPNWVDTDIIFPIGHPSPFRDELDISPTDVVALYSGSMGEKQGLEILICAAQRLAAHPRIKFVLCGDGAARKKLELAAKACTNIRFLPLQSLDRYNDLLNAANIHLLPQRSGAADLVMPSKLGGILAVGGALIATATAGTEISEVVAAAGGILSAPDDAEALAKNILLLAYNPELQKTMGQRARVYANDNLARHTVLTNWFEKLVARITATPPSAALREGTQVQPPVQHDSAQFTVLPPHGMLDETKDGNLHRPMNLERRKLPDRRIGAPCVVATDRRKVSDRRAEPEPMSTRKAKMNRKSPNGKRPSFSCCD